MPEFQYIARELSGRQVSGLLTAANERDALTTLSGRSLFPVRVSEAASEGTRRKRATRRVRGRHLAVFYTQLSDLLRSGVPLLRSLELLAERTPHATLRDVIDDVREQVADGTRLAEAMRKHERVFGELSVSMIRAGEEGSFLEDVLKRISAFTDHQEALKSKVMGAMVYPLFLLGMGTVIVSLMLTFFVPKFTPIFENMSQRGSLPWATTALMGMSDMVQAYGVLILASLGGGGLLLAKHLQTDVGRRRYDTFRLRAFGIGPVVRSLAVSRFCRILGTLLKNGVPILQSLRIAKDATGNVILSDAIGVAADSISTGKSLARPLGASGEFPVDVVEMISVAEEANTLEQVLVDIADNMERLTQRQLDLFVRLLEPILLTLMALMILFVVIALMLPIMQSSGIF